MVAQPRRADVLRRVQSEEARVEIMRAFMLDLAAPSSRATGEGHWNTWVAFHNSWFGTCIPALPLTTAKLFAVSACFKDGGYRSYRAFVGKAREHHILEGHAWTEELDLVRRKATLSVLRGLGVARQSAPFDLLAVLRAVQDGSYQPAAGSPMGWSSLLVLATFFMMREVEVAAAVVSHITVDFVAARVTLRLPISKSDSGAVGCSRTWGCICSDSGARPDCPFHAAVAQLNLLKVTFGDFDLSAVPLFPTASGDVVLKVDVGRALEASVAATGATVVTESGGRLLGGHSFRVTGAQRLAALGVEVAKIMVMARWAGEAVLRYVREAPLESLPAEVIALEERRSAALVLKTLRQEIAAVRAQTQRLGQDEATRAAALERRVAEIQGAAVGRETARAPERCIIARIGRASNAPAYKVHDARGTDFSSSPCTWRAVCGRRFGAWTFERHLTTDAFPIDTQCRGCFGAAPVPQPACSSSSSSSSGESSS